MNTNYLHTEHDVQHSVTGLTVTKCLITHNAINSALDAHGVMETVLQV